MPGKWENYELKHFLVSPDPQAENIVSFTAPLTKILKGCQCALWYCISSQWHYRCWHQCSSCFIITRTVATQWTFGRCPRVCCEVSILWECWMSILTYSTAIAMCFRMPFDETSSPGYQISYFVCVVAAYSIGASSTMDAFTYSVCFFIRAAFNDLCVHLRQLDEQL